MIVFCWSSVNKDRFKFPNNGLSNFDPIRTTVRFELRSVSNYGPFRTSVRFELRPVSNFGPIRSLSFRTTVPFELQVIRTLNFQRVNLLASQIIYVFYCLKKYAGKILVTTNINTQFTVSFIQAIFACELYIKIC